MCADKSLNEPRNCQMHRQNAHMTTYRGNCPQWCMGGGGGKGILNPFRKFSKTKMLAKFEENGVNILAKEIAYSKDLPQLIHDCVPA